MSALTELVRRRRKATCSNGTLHVSGKNNPTMRSCNTIIAAKKAKGAALEWAAAPSADAQSVAVAATNLLATLLGVALVMANDMARGGLLILLIAFIASFARRRARLSGCT